MRNERYKKYDIYRPTPGSSRHVFVSTPPPVSQVKQTVSLPSPSKPNPHNYKNDNLILSSDLLADIKPYKPPVPKPTPQKAKPVYRPVTPARPVNAPSLPTQKPNIATVALKARPKQLMIKLSKNKALSQKLFYSFGVFVFITSLGLNMYAFMLNKQAKNEVSEVAAASSSVDEQGVKQGTGSEPASDKPNERAMFNYRVAPDKPRYLRIPSQSVNARVKELGLTSEGTVDAPWNIHDVGWYNGSIVPGSKNGVSLILGHVSGTTMPGVFKTVSSLTVNEVIEIEKGNGEILKYKVDKVEEYDTDSIDMAKILYEVEKGHQSLRLMTCSGKYDSNTRTYQSRTVVYTSPIK